MITISREELVSLDFGDICLAWFDTHVPSGRIEFADRTAFMIWAAQREGHFHARWVFEAADRSYRGANLRGATLRRGYFEFSCLRDADLRGADLREADLLGANLECADLRGADLHNAILKDACLHRADLRGADIGEANLEGADLSDADLRGAILQRARRLATDPLLVGYETYVDEHGITRLWWDP